MVAAPRRDAAARDRRRRAAGVGDDRAVDGTTARQKLAAQGAVPVADPPGRPVRGAAGRSPHRQGPGGLQRGAEAGPNLGQGPRRHVQGSGSQRPGGDRVPRGRVAVDAPRERGRLRLQRVVRSRRPGLEGAGVVDRRGIDADDGRTCASATLAGVDGAPSRDDPDAPSTPGGIGRPRGRRRRLVDRVVRAGRLGARRRRCVAVGVAALDAEAGAADLEAAGGIAGRRDR